MTKNSIVQAISKTFYHAKIVITVLSNLLSSQKSIWALLGPIDGESLPCPTVWLAIRLPQVVFYLMVKSLVTKLKTKMQPSLAVFQDPRMGTAPRMTVFESLMLASRPRQKPGFKRSHQGIIMRPKIAEIIPFGVEDHKCADWALSGGQRQAIIYLYDLYIKTRTLALRWNIHGCFGSTYLKSVMQNDLWPHWLRKGDLRSWWYCQLPDASILH